MQFVRQLPHPPERVWRAITNTDELAAWFPGFELEHRQGGKFSIRFSGDCEGPAHVSGIVDVYDPPHELQCGSMRWQLEPDGAGCRLTFTDIVQFAGDHRCEFEITNSVLAGWHFYVDRLESSLAGCLDPDDTLEYDYSLVDLTGRAPR